MAAIKATTAASNCLGRKASGVSSTSRSSSYRRHANVHEQTCLRTLFVHHQNTESSFVQRRLSDFRSRRTQRQKNGRQCTTCLFTGIVQGTAVVKEVCEQKDFKQLQVEFPVGRMDSVQIGGSVALNGTCLTVTEAERNTLSFDVIVETLRATNLGGLNAGHVVNFERSARFGDEVGGHTVSGHVHCTAEIIQIESSDNNRKLYFKVPPQWMKYILPKGFIAIDGCSLTVGEVDGDVFSVYLIPETIKVTVFASRAVGSLVNIEIDTQTQVIVDTVERVLASANSG